jgi:hypothetical protein
MRGHQPSPEALGASWRFGRRAAVWRPSNSGTEPRSDGIFRRIPGLIRRERHRNITILEYLLATNMRIQILCGAVRPASQRRESDL